MAEKKEKRYVSDNAQLMAEWNWKKNNDLGFDPQILTQGSRTKVWWVCKKGHSYEAQIKNRVSGNGCSYCAGKKVLKGYNDIETFYPQVATEWNYEKNGDITPETVTFASNKKVWWKCKKCGGEYESYVSNRTTKGVGCPYCAGQKVLDGYNDLQSQLPNLAAEWSKKNTAKPTEVTVHSNKKVYWICPLGHDDYLMSVKQRSNRQGCPICAQQSQTSFPEQAIYFYLKQVFQDTVNRYIFDGREIDIFIPSKNVGIEYNGYFSHKEKTEKDALKKEFFKSIGIALFVVKEYKYTEEKEQADFYINERTTFNDLTCLVKDIFEVLGVDNSINIDCSRDAITIKNQYVALRKENSIATIRPDLVDRWDYEKNGTITPEMVTLGTGQRFYWKCKICNRSYLALPSKIAQGSVCSKHRNLLKRAGNDLASKYPELLKYWDYTKNDVNPSEIYGGGERVVHWKCEKGHSYTKSILKRIRGEGCPICAGKKVLAGFNDLETLRPDIAKTWNYSKNENVLPSQVTEHSNKKYWWICDKGHEWETSVNNRSNGRGCPECYREKRSKQK
ncbi:MAG: zinc-ribbon domain-containing protein [Clostridia bacterium]|nr:zinc-ribbon domain-containing protein [Clostridia bacterium]